MGRHGRHDDGPSATGRFDGCAFVCALFLAVVSFMAGFHSGREWQKQEPPPSLASTATAPRTPVAIPPPPPPTPPPVAPTVLVEAPDAVQAPGLLPYPPLRRVQRSGPLPPGVEDRRAVLRPLVRASDVGSLVRDGAGRIWAGTTDALATVDASPAVVVTRADLPWFVPNFRRLAVDPTGSVCFVGGGEGQFLIRVRSDGTFDAVPMAVPANTSYDCLLASVPDGILAIDSRLSRGVVWLPYLDGEWRAPRVVAQAQPWDEVCSLVPDGKGLLLKTPTRVFRIEGENARPFVALEEDPAAPVSPAARLLQTLGGHRARVDMSREASARGGWGEPDMKVLARRSYASYRLSVPPGGPLIPIWSETDTIVAGSLRLTVPRGPGEHPYLGVTATLADGPGRLWIGTDRGLVLLDDDRLRLVGPVASTYRRPVLAAAATRSGTGLVTGRDGTVVLGYGAGASVVATSGLVPLASRDEGSPDVTVWVGCPSEDILVGTATELSAVRCDAGGGCRLESLISWAEVGASVRLAATDLTGGLWMRTDATLFHAPAGRPLDRLPPPLSGPGPSPGLLAAAPDGRVWVTESGGRVVALSTFRGTVTVTDLLDYHNSPDAVFGPERMLLACGNFSVFVTPSSVVPTGFDGMRCLAASPSGVLWGLRSGFDEDGASRLVRWDGERVTQVTIDRPRLGWGRVSIAPAPDGGLYLMDSGLWHLAAEGLE